MKRHKMLVQTFAAALLVLYPCVTSIAQGGSSWAGRMAQQDQAAQTEGVIAVAIAIVALLAVILIAVAVLRKSKR